MEKYPIHGQSDTVQEYAPVESMKDSNTGFMTREFIRRAVFSDGTKDYRSPAEPMPGDRVTIKLRTARGNASAVALVTDVGRFPMTVTSSNALFDWYEAAFTVPARNTDYYFIIWCGDAHYYYNAIGVCEEPDPAYSFRLLPGFRTPEWAKGAVMYQIFTDRFCNGASVNAVLNDEYSYLGGHSEQVYDWSRIPKADDVREFYGGDLEGVRKKLDYLVWLGIEVIYFNPLFVSPSSHKYDTQDYDHIDPHFTVIPFDAGDLLAPGDDDNRHAARYIARVTDERNLESGDRFFADFVAEAHSRGIKVILDGVFNHCGSFNRWLDRQGIYEQSGRYPHGAYAHEDSPYRSFFKFEDENAWPCNESYAGWWGYKTLPKLNYEGSQELEDYILGIARKWVSPPYCCDGWRLDVAADLGNSPEYNHAFWKKFRRVVKEANPEAIIIAENYNDSKKWLQGDEWDTIMNYEAFMEPVTWFLTGMEKHSDSFSGELLNNRDAFFGAMLHHMAGFSTQTIQTAMNQLSNHDHSRFLTRTNRRVGRITTVGAEAASEGISKACMREAIVIQMTWPGAPCVYYGDEAGVCGWTDPDDRRTYPWGREDKELLEFYKQLIGLHRAYDCLKTGSVKFLAGAYGVIAYGRFNGSERIITVVNNSDDAVNVDVPVWETGADGKERFVSLVRTDDRGYNFYAEVYRPENGVITLRMECHSAVILKNLPEYLA